MEFFWRLVFIALFATYSYSLHQPAPRRKPFIRANPQNAFGLLKQPLKLSCQADGEPPPLITWYKDDHQVKSLRDLPGTSTKIIKSDQLHFLSFEREDEGTYYCNASNSEGWTKSNDASVLLAYLDPMSDGPKNHVTSVGEIVVLPCKIPYGLPEPTVSWYHNSMPVQPNSRILINDGNLHISKTQKQDAGTYLCEVINIAGRRESASATLTVHQKPRFEITPSNQQVKAGDDVEFVCRVNGDPKPSILWRRENGPHIPEDRSILRDDKSLRIIQVRREDAGTYVCQAKNEAGSVDASARLTVLSAPSFTITPTDVTVDEGEKAIFHCLSIGSPHPHIRWVHNGEYFLLPDIRLTQDTGMPRVFVNHEGSLVITTARKSDEGKYECRASHKTGMVRSSANLFVSDLNPLPIIVIDIGPHNQTVVLGTTATLRCEANLIGSINRQERFHQPPYGVNVAWSRNGVMLGANSDPRIVLLSQGMLKINDIRAYDEGNYTCHAELTTILSQQPRQLHPTEWTAALHVSRTPLNSQYPPVSVESLPRPPESVEIVDVGDSYIAVRCAISARPVDPLSSGAMQYDQTLINELDSRISSAHLVERARVRVEYISLDGDDGWVVAAEGRPDEIVRLSGLKPESGYRILARTVNRRGVGRAYVVPHTVYTKRRHRFVNFTNYPTEHINSVSVSNPKVISISTSEVEVSGRICGSPDAIQLLTGIRVRYRPVPIDRCLNPGFPHVGGHTDNCPYYPAYPYGGIEDHSEENTSELAENYCSLQLMQDLSTRSISTQLHVAPSVPTDQYRFMELNLVESASFRLVMDNLSPFVCYEVQVDAYSEGRTGGRVYSECSQMAEVLTFDSTPNRAPQEVKARWVGDNDEILEIVWSPPPTGSTNGLTTGYTLRLLGTERDQQKTVRVGPESTSYRIEDLQPDANYTLYMAAMTCHGEGVRSEPHPIIASHFLRLMGHNSSDFFSFVPHPSTAMTTSAGGFGVKNGLSLSTDDFSSTTTSSQGAASSSLFQHTWLIICFVCVFLVWLIIFIVILFCRRQRRQRVKQRFPPNSGAVAEETAFGVKRPGGLGGGNRNSKVGLLDSGKEVEVAMPPISQTPHRPPSGRIGKHSSPRLQMGTGILTVPRPTTRVNDGEVGGVDYGAPGPQVSMGPEAIKLASTGSIFLATGGTTSSSSQDSSLHKGAGEAAADSENVGAPASGVTAVDDIEDPADANSVSPYASTSLIEQLRLGRGTFPDLIPPPPRYPPPPVPQDSPPATPCSGGPAYQAPPINGPPREECHYAQSDLQKSEEMFLTNGTGTGGGYGVLANGYIPAHPGYGSQEQYWPNGSAVGMCYMQQPNSMPSQTGSIYMPHMMTSGSMQCAMSPPAYLTQQRGQPTYHQQQQHQHRHHHQPSNDPLQHHLMMMSGGAVPSSALTDDVVLPSSTLSHTSRAHPGTPIVP